MKTCFQKTLHPLGEFPQAVQDVIAEFTAITSYEAHGPFFGPKSLLKALRRGEKHRTITLEIRHVVTDDDGGSRWKVELSATYPIEGGVPISAVVTAGKDYHYNAKLTPEDLGGGAARKPPPTGEVGPDHPFYGVHW